MFLVFSLFISRFCTHEPRDVAREPYLYGRVVCPCRATEEKESNRTIPIDPVVFNVSVFDIFSISHTINAQIGKISAFQSEDFSVSKKGLRRDPFIYQAYPTIVYRAFPSRSSSSSGNSTKVLLSHELRSDDGWIR